MRLIDADKLLEIYKKWIPQLLSKEDEGDRRGVETCIMVLEDMQTVDAVPVVRCAKCRNWVENDDGQYVCALFDIANSYGEPVVTKPDDFCSYGKRKGEVD